MFFSILSHGRRPSSTFLANESQSLVHLKLVPTIIAHLSILRPLELLLSVALYYQSFEDSVVLPLCVEVEIRNASLEQKL